MWLLILAAIGLFVPGGLFLYWMLNDYTTLAAFLALSFLGTLAFGIPMFIWLNWRRSPGHPTFANWWRAL